MVAKSSGKIYDSVSRRVPDPILGVLRNIDDRKKSIYSKIDESSKRTRKEFDSTVTRTYLCIVLSAFVEIAFMLLTPFIIEWTSENFFGDEFMWRFIILMVNVLVLYIPVYYLFYNFKTILGLTISDIYKRGMISPNSKLANITYRFVNSSTSVLGLMVAIIVIIIVPNGLGIGEHLIVLGMALIILFLYNRSTLRKKIAREAYDKGEEEETDVDLDSFKKIIETKKRKLTTVDVQSDAESTVSIDTNDFRQE